MISVRSLNLKSKIVNPKFAYCLLFTSYLLTSCATYYQNNFQFNKEFESGNLKPALQTLKNKAGQANGKDRFLYFVNKGLVLSMLGEYDESNKFFEDAYLLGRL